MLTDHPERSCWFFAADYQPEVGFLKSLPDAAEVLQKKLDTLAWGTTTPNNGYFFRVPARKLIFSIDLQRLFAQGIGLHSWQSSLNDFASMFRSALEKAGVKALKRVGFKVWSFSRTEMSHSEMADLMFGSFLVPRQELGGLYGNTDDALVLIHGSHGDMKLQLTVAPMNAEQVAQQVSQISNLEHFSEPKFFDAGLKEFRDRVVGDCLFVDLDLFRQDVDCSDVLSFTRNSLTAADEVVTATVRRLKHLQVKRKGR